MKGTIMTIRAMDHRQARGRKVRGSLLMAAAWLVLGILPGHAGTPTMKTTVRLIVTNAQGTVVATMTPQGQVTYTAAYRPYGKQAEGTPKPGPGYTGHVNDPDTGLVYMQQRYYDPMGRFLSPDPVGPTPGNIFSFNRYAYANNNPMRFTDPTGRSSQQDGSSGSQCGADVPVATCKQQQQRARQNQRVRDFGGHVTIFGNLESYRKACIVAGGGCSFVISNNPSADASAPWYEAGWLGKSAVTKNSASIFQASAQTGVGTRLIKAIMYMEVSHGYYDALPALFGKNHSILPMNINYGYWHGAFGSRIALLNPQINVLEGARMIRAIEANLPASAPISHIATLYNQISALRVSDYGARVQAIYSEEPWK